MKSFLAIASLVATVLAAPFPDPPAGAQVFNLVTKSDQANFNGLYLSPKGGKLVAAKGSGAKFWSSPYSATGTLSLHVTDETHQVALRGSSGLLELVDVVNPTGDSIPRGQMMEWSTFVVDGQGQVNVKDGADIPSREWVVYNSPGGMTVALYDGFTKVEGKSLGKVTLLATAAQ